MLAPMIGTDTEWTNWSGDRQEHKIKGLETFFDCDHFYDGIIETKSRSLWSDWYGCSNQNTKSNRTRTIEWKHISFTSIENEFEERHCRKGSQNAVLVLSTRNSQNKPMTVDLNGNVDDDLTFEYGEGAGPSHGCGAILTGEMWYFGGKDRRQVSKIEGCQLIRQGSLNFDYFLGSCNSFLEPTPRILLCFSGDGYPTPWKVCHSFDGENYVQVEDSKYSHQGTRGLGNYGGKGFTTGCAYVGCTSRVATELLDMTTMKWSDGPDYPFYKWISHYSTTQTLDAVYIIGGVYTKNIVAEFKNDQWRRLADLNQGRHVHGSISIGGQTMIIGGYFNGQTPLVTEVWELENGNSTTIEPTLPDGHYANGMALFVVEKDFCKK